MNEISKRVASIDLTGTEKQIQWGRSIRAQQVSKLASLGNKAVLRLLKPIIIESEIEAMNAWKPERLGLLATLTVLEACSNPSARFWIDSRTENPLSWIPSAWETVRQHHLQHPFTDEC